MSPLLRICMLSHKFGDCDCCCHLFVIDVMLVCCRFLLLSVFVGF